MSYKKIIKEIIEAEKNAVASIPVSDAYEEAVNIIYKYVHLKGGKVVTSGMGKAGEIAHNIATTMSATGTPAIFLHPGEAQHGDIGIFQKNDVLLAVSNSGKTDEIIKLTDLVKKLYENIPMIVISSNPDSLLAKRANVFIYTGNPKEVCPLGLTPTTSTTTMTVIGDILVVLLMKKINFTAEDYAKRHHGGYLGEKSRNMAKKSF